MLRSYLLLLPILIPQKFQFLSCSELKNVTLIEIDKYIKIFLGTDLRITCHV